MNLKVAAAEVTTCNRRVGSEPRRQSDHPYRPGGFVAALHAPRASSVQDMGVGGRPGIAFVGHGRGVCMHRLG